MNVNSKLICHTHLYEDNNSGTNPNPNAPKARPVIIYNPYLDFGSTTTKPLFIKI